MARTLPPSRVTTGTTAVDFGGLSPIDAYSEDIDRPLAYFESTCLDSISVATGSIPTVYVKATLTAGLSGNMSATAGHFKSWATGTCLGKISSLASWVHLAADFVPYAGGLDVAGVITPLNVGVRCEATVATLANSMVVFGMHAQYLPGSASLPIAPTYLFFARLNTGGTAAVGTLTALFYAENPHSIGWVTGTLTSVAAGHVPLCYVHSAGDAVAYVNLYFS